VNIGKRIKYIRKLRNKTQKWLGMAVGFSEKTADIRIAQYESGIRSPKQKLVTDIATALSVSPHTLSTPEIDNPAGLMHMFFVLEDMYGFHVREIDGELYLSSSNGTDEENQSVRDILCMWSEMAAMLESGVICREEYNNWRYNFY